MFNATLGIDPGWSSCGVCLQLEGKVLGAKNFVPSEYGTPWDFYNSGLLPWLEPLLKDGEVYISNVRMERFVAYAGVHSEASEKILMLIGALAYALEESCSYINAVDIGLVRAIDWKQKLCKYLVRTKGFSNPYPSFDKQYSILAAKTLWPEFTGSNHEADAVCLSFLTIVEDHERNHRKPKTGTQ